jgi:hypothetical protein
MIAAVLERIRELGRETSGVKPGASMQEQLAGIRFNQVLFDDTWEGYGIEEFRDGNMELYERDRDAFIESLLDHLHADNDEPRGQCFWRSTYFTPLTEGTDDHNEWKEIFSNLELTEIREVVGEGHLEFVQIIENYGWPDHYYVCVSDPNPENPVVFGTDHESFFEEITVEGTLQEFFGLPGHRNRAFGEMLLVAWVVFTDKR